MVKEATGTENESTELGDLTDNIHSQGSPQQEGGNKEQEGGGRSVEAVQSACMNGMPVSIAQASPGGTSPRTININKLLTPIQFEGKRERKEEPDHHLQEEEVQGGHDEGHDEGQDGMWVKGAELSDNDRYKALLDYMEKMREETKQRIREDDERKEEAKRKEDTWSLMKEAVDFIKKNGKGWVERRSRECERIREEEKLDRLAVVKQKKRRYGISKLSKEENSRLKLRTEERLVLAKARENLWKRYRDGDRVGEEEGEAWEVIRRGVAEIDKEEGGGSESYSWMRKTDPKKSVRFVQPETPTVTNKQEEWQLQEEGCVHDGGGQTEEGAVGGDREAGHPDVWLVGGVSSNGGDDKVKQETKKNQTPPKIDPKGGGGSSEKSKKGEIDQKVRQKMLQKGGGWSDEMKVRQVSVKNEGGGSDKKMKVRHISVPGWVGQHGGGGAVEVHEEGAQDDEGVCGYLQDGGGIENLIAGERKSDLQHDVNLHGVEGGGDNLHQPDLQRDGQVHHGGRAGDDLCQARGVTTSVKSSGFKDMGGGMETKHLAAENGQPDLHGGDHHQLHHGEGGEILCQVRGVGAPGMVLGRTGSGSKTKHSGSFIMNKMTIKNNISTKKNIKELIMKYEDCAQESGGQRHDLLFKFGMHGSAEMVESPSKRRKVSQYPAANMIPVK